MSNSGIKKVMISTVDTDVVVIAVASFLKMNLDELWVSIGVGKSLRYFPILLSCTNLNAFLSFMY